MAIHHTHMTCRSRVTKHTQNYSLPPPLDSAATTADMVPAFREAAEQRWPSRDYEKRNNIYQAIINECYVHETFTIPRLIYTWHSLFTVYPP